MDRKTIYNFVDSTTENDLFDIFIPSYNRPKFVSAKLIRDHFTDSAKKKVHVVVRKEQYEDYKAANPEFHVLPIADDFHLPINGLASTRQFIFEYARDHGMNYIIDMDDDIKGLNFLYDGFSANAGDPCSKLSNKEDHTSMENFEQKILQAACKISCDVFAENPDVCLGNIRRQRMSQHVENAKIKYLVNSGPTPRQVTILNVKRLAEMNIDRDMIFDRHGDDIGFCAVILSKGGHLFNIPSLTYDYISEKCDSVVRTPETAKALHKYEWDMLQTYPIKDYLRISFKDEEGNYMWGDVNWQKFHKLNGSQRKKVFWEV